MNELARSARVISYSLCGDIESEQEMDGRFDAYVTQLRDVMDAAGVQQAALFGISFGGTVAARFAAEFPGRVTRLVIASSPGPGWRPNPRQSGYVASPWRSMPAFVAGALGRVAPEVAAALTTWPARMAFAVRYGWIALRYPALPPLMARRVRMMEARALELEKDCARITAPTLVITGDPALEHVVPVESTRRYVDLIRGARCVMMERTGHLGVLTQPQRFAALVSEFVNASHS
jgi:pimeloyl-ACP methyl ester carboxylesterase